MLQVDAQSLALMVAVTSPRSPSRSRSTSPSSAKAGSNRGSRPSSPIPQQLPLSQHRPLLPESKAWEQRVTDYLAQHSIPNMSPMGPSGHLANSGPSQLRLPTPFSNPAAELNLYKNGSPPVAVVLRHSEEGVSATQPVSGAGPRPRPIRPSSAYGLPGRICTPGALYAEPPIPILRCRRGHLSYDWCCVAALRMLSMAGPETR
jgi:hypothetical protein